MSYGVFRLEVIRIGFTPDFCAPKFRDGRPILETAQGLIEGKILPSDLPIMGVVWHRNRFFSVDNRRLVALRLADIASRDRGIRDSSFPLPLAVDVRLIDEQRQTEGITRCILTAKYLWLVSKTIYYLDPIMSPSKSYRA
jgi:hypothetical protein